MNIHEYQAKGVLKEFGVPVPKGIPAFTVEEAVAAAKQLPGPVWVVKAQIHAGGRGKGGGVKVVKDAALAEETAKQMIGMTLVTHQTGPEGRKVERLLIEEGVRIARELYLGLLVDRGAGAPVLMASSEGGMDIEEVAEKTPDAIKKVTISPVTGLTAFQARQLAFGIGLAPEHVNKAVKVMLGSVNVVLIALVVGGVVLIFFKQFREDAADDPDMREITYGRAILVGLFQAIAVVPGVSRAAATIIGGSLIGISKRSIVEFSFLLAVPTMVAA